MAELLGLPHRIVEEHNQSRRGEPEHGRHGPIPEQGVDIAYQSYADLNGTPYSVWLDKVNLTYW